MQSDYRSLWQLHYQLELSADRFDIVAQRGQIHVSLFLDFRYGWLSDMQCSRHMERGLTGDLSEFAEPLDFLF
jgi:hypothetical protein